jgi:hypothetical protein
MPKLGLQEGLSNEEERRLRRKNDAEKIKKGRKNA